MASVGWEYQRAGPRQLIVAGVMTSTADRDRYTDVFALPVRSVRLEADADVGAGRLRGGYPPERQRALQCHVDRHGELQRLIQLAGLDEVVITTDKLTPGRVAEGVLFSFGL